MAEYKYQLKLEMLPQTEGRHTTEWVELFSTVFRAPNNPVQMDRVIRKQICTKCPQLSGVWECIWAETNFERERDYSIALEVVKFPFRFSIVREGNETEVSNG